MIRGIEGKGIFRDTQDRQDFVTRLGDLSKQTGSRIPAWSVLGNHFIFWCGMAQNRKGYRKRFN